MHTETNTEPTWHRVALTPRRAYRGFLFALALLLPAGAMAAPTASSATAATRAPAPVSAPGRLDPSAPLARLLEAEEQSAQRIAKAVERLRAELKRAEEDDDPVSTRCLRERIEEVEPWLMVSKTALTSARSLIDADPARSRWDVQRAALANQTALKLLRAARTCEGVTVESEPVVIDGPDIDTTDILVGLTEASGVDVVDLPAISQ